VATLVTVSVEDVNITDSKLLLLPVVCWFLSVVNGIFIQLDKAHPHFGPQVTAYLNQHNENSWISRSGPITRPPRSPDLTLLDLFLWSLIKEMICRTKVNTREELLRWIMDAAACTREHHEMIQRAVNCCLERAKLCIENIGGHFEQLWDVKKK
jgi:hypothetical protein